MIKSIPEYKEIDTTYTLYINTDGEIIRRPDTLRDIGAIEFYIKFHYINDICVESNILRVLSTRWDQYGSSITVKIENDWTPKVAIEAVNHFIQTIKGVTNDDK